MIRFEHEQQDTRLPIEGQLSNLAHLSPCWAPGIITRCYMFKSAKPMDDLGVNPCTPLRTLTCTFEYPFVIFFTPRTTFDMAAVTQLA